MRRSPKKVLQSLQEVLADTTDPETAAKRLELYQEVEQVFARVIDLDKNSLGGSEELTVLDCGCIIDDGQCIITCSEHVVR